MFTSATDYVVWGLVIHLFVDWLLQNHWIATHKMNLNHPSAWLHAGSHCVGMLLVFPPLLALVIGLLHLAVDTRKPLTWWRRVFQQTSDGPAALHVSIWTDQVLHITIIALVALVAVRL